MTEPQHFVHATLGNGARCGAKPPVALVTLDCVAEVTCEHCRLLLGLHVDDEPDSALDEVLACIEAVSTRHDAHLRHLDRVLQRHTIALLVVGLAVIVLGWPAC